MTGSELGIKIILSAEKVMNNKGQAWEWKDQLRVHCSCRAKIEWLSEGVLKLQCATEPSGRLVKTHIAGPTPRASDSEHLGVEGGPNICLSKESLCYADGIYFENHWLRECGNSGDVMK